MLYTYYRRCDCFIKRNQLIIHDVIKGDQHLLLHVLIFSLLVSEINRKSLFLEYNTDLGSEFTFLVSANLVRKRPLHPSCYRLNISVHSLPVSYAEIPILKVMELGGGAFERQCGHEDTALINGISSLNKRDPRMFPCPFCYMRL